MSLLSYTELHELVEQGVITNVEPGQINAASIDVTAGDLFLVERESRRGADCLDWCKREAVPMEQLRGFVTLAPGDFCLASTEQTFNLPDTIAAEFKLKSSMARSGINHMLAGWCDPGWHGSVLTLELHNVLRHHAWTISAGDPIGQIVFYRCAPVPADRSYAARGRYNNDQTVSGVKP